MKEERLEIEFSLMAESFDESFKKEFPNYTNGLIRGEPGGIVLTPTYSEYDGAQELYNFHVRNDDIWILSFPKSGTTWTQEMVWLLANDCDFEGAKASLNQRSPFFELHRLYPKDLKVKDLAADNEQMAYMKQLKSPRIMKSHLPLALLPPKLVDTCKVVYIARNPKDVIVSYYYHYKLVKWHDHIGGIESFARRFMQDQVLYSPFFPHILDGWKRRNHPNVLFLFYEDLKKDLRQGIEKIARFLGKSLGEDQMGKLIQHLTFESMSQNTAVNKEDNKTTGVFSQDGKFMRKGETGDWKRHFSPEFSRSIDEWIQLNLRGSDLTFVDEL